MASTPSLLLLNVSPRGQRSGSRKLADEFLATWKAAHPTGRAVVRDLGTQAPPAVTAAWIEGAFAPADQQTSEAREAMRISNELVDELLGATEIVIATPMYNLNIPAALKLWIDQIVRVGRTFAIESTGYKGLATGRGVKVFVASGGDFRPGQPMGAMNFAEPYLRAVFGFIGITELEFVYAFNQSGAERETVLSQALLATRALAAA